MKIGKVFPDLLRPLGSADSVEAGLARTLRALVTATGADAGRLLFRPPRGAALLVVAGRRRLPATLAAWLRADGAAARAARLTTVTIPGGGRRRAAWLRVPLGDPRRPLGELGLLGRPGRLTRATLPGAFPRELGTAVGRVWELHRHGVRMTALNEIARLAASTESLDALFAAFGEAVARLVVLDGLGVSLVDAERGEFEIADLPARSLPRAPRQDLRLPLADTLLARLVAGATPLRIDDVVAAGVPARSRDAFVARGYRSVVLVPLMSLGAVLGAVTLAAREPRAFTDDDVEIVAELARPLASGIEQRRLVEESRRRAEEMAALNHTSRLISARLDAASVLDRISRAVTSLIGSTGCGIGLLDEEGRQLVHAAAHGFRSDEWRALAMPVGEGIIGRCAETGLAIRVNDITTDPRSARRDVDEREGIRSMLCVPLTGGGRVIGVISAFSTRPGVFTRHHQDVLEAFAEQAGIAIHNARLFEETVRRGRETRALFEAGRAVTASLDVQETVRVIMEEARTVLGVESCGLATLDEATGELVSVASLDLPPAMVDKIRVRPGEGIAGLAVSERKPMQSADLMNDPRVRYPELPRASGFRSMLVAPLRVGQRAIGTISVFRRDVHRFSGAEEELLLALADQAAIALEHARLYERLEAMVADRTRELDEQRRFVEVVLETLPLGVFVLDPLLLVVRANREGARVLGCDNARGRSFPDLLAPSAAAAVRAFLDDAWRRSAVAAREIESAVGGETKIFRLTTATLDTSGPHVVLLVEDITHAKRLEQQMLLTERLTTAGRLAAGVAHELNNPLATIAGCAEALLARTGEAPLARLPEIADFRHYLGLIEEESYRCKEITGSLLAFVREPGSRRVPTDVNGLVQKTIDLLSHQSRFSGRRFVTELADDLPAVTVNEGQIRQAFLGIAANALEAMDARGALTLRSRRHRDEVEVEFEDEGPGIPDEVLARIFDPFFTTKPPGQGTGLGLAIAQGIVTDHGGRIEVTSHVGKGSIFRVVLPA